jgi:tRNA (guanine-N7-)-methyltransferase
LTRHNGRKKHEIKNLPNVFNDIALMDNKWYQKAFIAENPLILELGCGKGEYTVELAKKFPDNNFLGVDIKGQRIWKGATLAIEAKLTNVCFARFRIEMIEQVIKEKIVSQIWIPFPDPFPRRSKANRRLISEAFINRYKNILIPGGVIHFKTDSEELFDFALETLASMNIEPIIQTRQLHQSPYLDELTSIQTRYEERFMAEGIAIKYLKFQLP